MRISVALAAHNGQRFLERQLESILQQSRRPDEIVISDDASEDGTVDLAESIAQRETSAGTRVVLLRNARPLGVTANFEQAISACTGDLVLLSDQDDVWSRTRVERTVEEFGRDDSMLLLGADARLIDEKGRDIGTTLFDALAMTPFERHALVSGEDLYAALLRRNLITGATAAIRPELMKIAAPFPTSWLHDEWLAMIAAVHGGLRSVPEVFIDYRQHGGNVVGAQRVSFAGKLQRLFDARTERNARLLKRADDLVDHLGAMSSESARSALPLASCKASHERMRSNLPTARARRIVPVLTAAARGQYGRFGGGMRDVARDLVQSD